MDEFWKFVEANIKANPSQLRLKYHRSHLPIDVESAIVQIECRQKFKKKLDETLNDFPYWHFPSVLSGEQSTSDLLARYHASLVDQGTRVCDLTAGLGIDAWHISKKAKSVTVCEIDAIKAEALKSNSKFLENRNINVINCDCRDYIIQAEIKAYDTVFIDPARRGSEGQRIFALADCEPNVTAMLSEIKRISKRLIVKMSPMLDISAVIKELPGTERIIALGTNTECKELIAVVNFDSKPKETIISAVTLTASGESAFEFTTADEENAQSLTEKAIPKPGDILYEPYPTVMKAAPFRILVSRYNVKKVHNNTHLYFSDAPVADFPGNGMRIVKVLPFASKHIKALKKEYPRINVATRNFPMTADKLRAKLGVDNGDNYRLMAATLADGSQAMLILTPLSL